MAHPIEQVGDLEIEHDPVFQARAWRFQRIAWVILTVVLAAALVGLLGPGPYSKTTIGDEKLKVEYQRLGRWQAPEELRFFVGSNQARDDRVVIWVDSPFLHAHDVQYITPSPRAVEAFNGGFNYIFAVEDQQALEVCFTIEPQKVGMKKGRVALGHQPPMVFRQFVFP